MNETISTGPAWIAAAALALGAGWFSMVVLVRSWRRLPLPLAAALALSLLVGFEAVLLDGLSLFHAVDRPALLAVHALLPAGALALAGRRGAAALTGLVRWRPGRRHLSLLPFVPLALLAAISAVRYAPNNWDSMTYHLARVAHWMQHHSVAPYPTVNPRQTFLSPGAEYLLLALQVISGSDRLANLVQLSCLLLVAAAAPVLARLAGAPAGLARWAWLLGAAAPMAVLQASSTQNDLVSAAMALAVVAACLPFLHRDRHGRTRRMAVLFLSGAAAAAALVKATALLATAPFLAAAAAELFVRRRRATGAGRALMALGIAAAILGPEVARRLAHPPPPGMVSAFSYPLWGEWGDRLLNLGRGFWRHLPVPRAVSDLLAPFPHRGCQPTDWLCTLALRPHEDYAGNPLQAVLVLASLGAMAVRWRQVPRRGRWAMGAAMVGYLLLHLVLRDNEWISRLQLPLLALSPVFLAAWPERLLGSPGRRWVVGAAGLALLGHGCLAARDNEARLPLWPAPVAYRPSYYNNRWTARFAHDFALERLRVDGCRRLGLFIGGESYDYPLTWRAMQAGVAVRYVTGPDDWPCAIFSDRGPPPGTRWTAIERPSRSESAEPGSLYVKSAVRPW